MAVFNSKGKRWAIVSLLLGLPLCQAQKTWASNFSINPIQIYVSSQASSTLVNLRNDSNEPLRFQLSAFNWQQNLQGEMQLSPTQDIVFFPSLLTLAPGEERKIRVATTASATSVEKTYRLFFEELPPLEKPQEASEKNKVIFLTKMGVPIFVQPAKSVVGGKVQDLAVQNSRFSFQVKNTGNVHFSAQSVQIKGYDAAQAKVFENKVEGWYILANGGRIFNVQLPKEKCAQIKSLTAEVQTDKTTMKETIEIPKGACGL